MKRRSDRVRSLRFVALSVTTLGSSGCLAFIGPELDSPASLGSHPVGVTTIGIEDGNGDRYLTAEVWYPAESASDAAPEVYEVQALEMTVARLRSVANTHRDVEPWQEGGARPVVLMSHGRGSTRFGNVSLAEVLASHGYVVAAPDHPGNTIDDQLHGIGAEERANSARDRPHDLSRVLDALVARSSQPRSLLSGLVDVDRVAVTGHSFGGLAALGVVGAGVDTERQRRECLTGTDDWRCTAAELLGPKRYRYRDPRIKAALLIAPAGYDLYRSDGVAQVDAPMLVVGARDDEKTPFGQFAKPTYDALIGPRYLLELEDAGHLTATDVCEVIDSIGFVAKTFGGKEAQDGCGVPGYSSRDALEAVADAALPFFELYLNGDSSAQERLTVALAPSGAHRVSTLVARGASKPRARR